MDKVVVDLIDAKWLVVGNTVLVDPRYLGEYKKIKNKPPRSDFWSSVWIKTAVAIYFVGVMIHVLIKGIL